MARPRIGLALGSGAARGMSHIGVYIDALAELRVRRQMVWDIFCLLGTESLARLIAGRFHAAFS